ncbi:MAG: ABC transporter permease [Chloroflexota bacterium]
METNINNNTPASQTITTATESKEALKYYSATQWQLVWWRFRRHRLALLGGCVLLFMGLIGLFANFIAPYGTGPLDNMNDTSYPEGAPQWPRFFDADGNFTSQPYFIVTKKVPDPILLQPKPVPLLIAAPTEACDTAKDTLKEAKSEVSNPLEAAAELKPFQDAVDEACFDQVTRPIEFFVHGDPYDLLGIIPTDRHLFGAGPIDIDGLIETYGEGEVKKIMPDLEKAAEAGYHLFGTGKLGDDLFSQLMFATRTSLSIGVIGVFLSFVLALIIGGVAGYFGGWTDYIIQRFTEVIRVIPIIPLYMGLAAAMPKEWSNMQIFFVMSMILGLFGWPTLARRIRSQLLTLRTEDYVLSARLSGARPARIISRHLLPAFTSYIIVDLVISFPYMILSETALSFVGLGLRRPTLSWGVLLQQAQSVKALEQQPWLFIPVIFVVVAVLAFTILGDGLRDAADPYQVSD